MTLKELVHGLALYNNAKTVSFKREIDSKFASFSSAKEICKFDTDEVSSTSISLFLLLFPKVKSIDHPNVFALRKLGPLRFLLLRLILLPQKVSFSPAKSSSSEGTERRRGSSLVLVLFRVRVRTWPLRSTPSRAESSWSFSSHFSDTWLTDLTEPYQLPMGVRRSTGRNPTVPAFAWPCVPLAPIWTRPGTKRGDNGAFCWVAFRFVREEG